MLQRDLRLELALDVPLERARETGRGGAGRGAPQRCARVRASERASKSEIARGMEGESGTEREREREREMRAGRGRSSLMNNILIIITYN